MSRPEWLVVLILASCLLLATSFFAFNGGCYLGIAGEDDPELADIRDSFLKYESLIKTRPKIQRLRFPFTILAEIPLINGHLKGRVVGRFIPERNLILIKKYSGSFGCDDGIVAHELGHAIGWEIFLKQNRESNMRRAWDDSELSSEEMATRIGWNLIENRSVSRGDRQ